MIQIVDISVMIGYCYIPAVTRNMGLKRLSPLNSHLSAALLITETHFSRKSLLEVIKETVLSHLTKKCPPHVQVIGLLCRTPEKESRHELLRRVAAGGGVFQGENGTKVHLPGANLNDIANQADDLLETMETRSVIPDRKLLARLVLIREEARNMMGGGILDERNDRGLTTLPESEVNFLTKLVALRPGKTVRDMIKSVMQGKDEGADSSDREDGVVGDGISGGIAGRASVTGRKPLPVRPGMFLETVSKVLGGICRKRIWSHSTASRMGSSEYAPNSSRNCILVFLTVFAGTISKSWGSLL
ncbi:protein PEP-RELATED DEVELOPMENT ARRESTED 1, chloroplastic [Sesamum angolense]|uniref:Protein PEP-RELATED DEVELOPMENT ARRESTED 1, chloroplastic n=1 Tax=Sesamum angolense TaxID=2727404 RepID=A0AAE1X903_9LAMI|nr:protein PEP-RELATED DEVELOPMENT ARRESTED 1, chloroplastic [Sesamum angolense]